jgi:PelA/Pel-15E family pectate lyase
VPDGKGAVLILKMEYRFFSVGTPNSGLFVGLAVSLLTSAVSAESNISWSDCMRQPISWYATPEAARIAANVCAYQRASGGWPKNIDMARLLTAAELAALAMTRTNTDSTIDNGATTTQMRFLARIQSSAPRDQWRDAVIRGIEYLLSAQYPSGGWPQYWPSPKGYSAHITFNDNAMVNVLNLLQDVGAGSGDFGFVDSALRERAAAAVKRGVDCILRCQIKVNGRLTVWCAQHDEKTLEPVGARNYEHPSLSGAESVGITRFLMSLDNPESRVIDAVEAAVAWFESAKLHGIRIIKQADVSLPKGYDKVVVEDPAAPPVWARFYDLRTGRPIFSGRDGVVKTRLADIEYERRVGYSWYTESPAGLLTNDYPAWRRHLRQ